MKWCYFNSVKCMKSFHIKSHLVKMIIAELKIKEYIKMFRRKYANVNLIPKQHLLEFHCIDWLKRFGFGMAFHGEQGGGTFTCSS